MIILCDRCFTEYDDARRLTYCPHDKLMDDVDMDRKIEALALMDRARGKLVRFRGAMTMGNPNGHRLLAVTWNGMIEIEGGVGEFAPHLFEVVEA